MNAAALALAQFVLARQHGDGKIFWVAIPIYAVIVGLQWQSYRGTMTMLNVWASENRLRLTRRVMATWRNKPSFWPLCRDRPIFRVSAECEDGHIREGWVRLSMRSGTAEARWDDDPDEEKPLLTAADIPDALRDDLPIANRFPEIRGFPVVPIDPKKLA